LCFPGLPAALAALPAAARDQARVVYSTRLTVKQASLRDLQLAGI
jgi:hypothetical protein